MINRRYFLAGAAATAAASALPAAAAVAAPALPYPLMWTGPSTISVLPGRHYIAAPLNVPEIGRPICLHHISFKVVDEEGGCVVERIGDEVPDFDAGLFRER